MRTGPATVVNLGATVLLDLERRVDAALQRAAKVTVSFRPSPLGKNANNPGPSNQKKPQLPYKVPASSGEKIAHPAGPVNSDLPSSNSDI